MALKDYDINDGHKPLGGGWRYMQPMPDGQIFRIPTHGTLPSGEQLVEAVKTFRTNNGINMGNVELDVADYIRRVSPINDAYNGKKGILGTVVAQPFIPLITRIREWIDKLAPRKPELVDITEANRRAQICIGCNQNIRWMTDCGTCNDTIEYMGKNARQLPNYELDDALLGCRIHNAHLPTLVFLDQAYLPARIEKQPAHCWIPESNIHGHQDNQLPNSQEAQP